MHIAIIIVHMEVLPLNQIGRTKCNCKKKKKEDFYLHPKNPSTFIKREMWIYRKRKK